MYQWEKSPFVWGILLAVAVKELLYTSKSHSHAKPVETLLIKEDFSVLDIFVFSYPSPHFNDVVAAKSIGQSNILSSEKGGGGGGGGKEI